MLKDPSIAAQLLEINAVKLKPNTPFTWSSGMKSPIYCDNRLLLGYPKLRAKVKNQFAISSKDFDSFEAIAGVATAGIPHGALLADKLELPFIYVRSSAKAHGRQNKIEGELKKGSKILVIEDLISTGGSSILATEALIEAGYEVVGVMAIFSYGFEIARLAFEKINVPFQTLINLDEMLVAAQSMNYLKPEEVEIVNQWQKDPKKWSDNYINKNNKINENI